jgi:hypothetical protein
MWMTRLELDTYAFNAQKILKNTLIIEIYAFNTKFIILQLYVDLNHDFN